MEAHSTKLVSPAEYLELERQAPYKSEYFQGETFALAGASRRHNKIVANIIIAIGNQLGMGPCDIFGSDMRLRITALDKYTYPDVVVTCGKEQFEDEQSDTLLNPTLIVEVLSESTEAYDRGKKFEHYQTLESLKTYLLVSQDACRVEQFDRHDSGRWQYYACHNIDDEMNLTSIGCQLKLADVYLKVDLKK